MEASISLTVILVNNDKVTTSEPLYFIL